VLQNANHYSFIAPFPESIKGRVGEAAQDPDGFDRAAMHAKLNPDILDFFDRKRNPSVKGGLSPLGAFVSRVTI
jgi:predicted dienelactone hydrolase